MFNPTDIELLDTEEGKKKLDPNFVNEFENNKGEDDDE